MSLPPWIKNAAQQRQKGGRVARGGAIAMAANITAFVANIISAALLARLLTATDFGLMGMVAPLMMLVAVFADGGMSSRTLQQAELVDEEMDLTFWVGLLSALAMAALMAAATPVLALIFADSRVIPISLALALTFVIQAVGLQHAALCKRCLRQDIPAIGTVAGAAGSIAVAVSLALTGAGVWALVGLQISRVIIRVAVLWAMTRWVPGRPRHHPALREVLSFGGAMIGARLALMLGRSFDKVLIGAIYGAAALGPYQLAYQLSVAPMFQLRGPLGDVAVPWLAQMRDDPSRFMAGLGSVMAVSALLLVPALSVASILATPLTTLVLGPDWPDAGPIFAWLTLGLALEQTRASMNLGFVALGRPWLTARWNMISAVVCILGYAAAAPFGVEAIALSFALSQLALLPLSFVYAARVTGYGYWPAIRPLAVPVAAAAVAAGLTEAIGNTITPEGGLGMIAIGAVACTLATLGGIAMALPPVWRNRAIGHLHRLLSNIGLGGKK